MTVYSEPGETLTGPDWLQETLSNVGYSLPRDWEVPLDQLPPAEGQYLTQLQLRSIDYGDGDYDVQLEVRPLQEWRQLDGEYTPVWRLEPDQQEGKQ